MVANGLHFMFVSTAKTMTLHDEFEIDHKNFPNYNMCVI